MESLLFISTCDGLLTYKQLIKSVNKEELYKENFYPTNFRVRIENETTVNSFFLFFNFSFRAPLEL